MLLEDCLLEDRPRDDISPREDGKKCSPADDFKVEYVSDEDPLEQEPDAVTEDEQEDEIEDFGVVDEKGRREEPEVDESTFEEDEEVPADMEFLLRHFHFVESVKNIFRENCSMEGEKQLIDELYDAWGAEEKVNRAKKHVERRKRRLSAAASSINSSMGSSSVDVNGGGMNGGTGVAGEELFNDDDRDALDYLDLILEKMPKNFHAFYGDNTAYIFKSPHMSRGRGLKVMTCKNRLRAMLEEAYSRSALNQRWFCIVQKYLEKPFLVDYKGELVKCDLRMWVSAVNWNPVIAIVHPLPYFRLATTKFSFKELGGRQDQRAHLTNRTIQLANDEHDGEDDPDFQMIYEDFLSYLKQRHGQHWVERWKYFTWPLMMDATRCALLASQDAVVHAHHTYAKRVAARHPGRVPKEGPRAFELYGMDFSLDFELRPWLLEANVSWDGNGQITNPLAIF